MNTEIITKRQSPFLRRASLENSRWFGRCLFSFLARGKDTSGQFSLTEMDMVRGDEPPPHVHQVDDEGVYVLHGEMEWMVGADVYLLGPGDFLHLPVGIQHHFKVLSMSAKAVLITTPSGLEEAFVQLSQPARELKTREKAPRFDLDQFMATFGAIGLAFSQPQEADQLPLTELQTSTLHKRSRWTGGHRVTPLLQSDATHGRLAVLEILGRRGQEPPPHMHHREDECFYLLEGEVIFHVGRSILHAHAGDMVFLPKGVPHWFEFQTETAKALLILTPGGFEEYFLEYSTPALSEGLPPATTDSFDPAWLEAVSQKYEIDFLTPSL